MKKTRVIAYSLSTAAIACYFLYPDLEIAISAALMIQTLAFITIAGKSFADGLLLVGISTILIGIMPAENPLILGSEFYKNTRLVLILLGTVLVLINLTIIVLKERKALRQKKQVPK